MEVEAKFRIPDEQTLTRLLEAPSLAGFSLGPAVQCELHDCYLDTPEGAFRAAGYALRLRRSEKGSVVTLKGLGHADGGIHRRAEHEIAVSTPFTPETIPAGAVRDRVLRLCGSHPLRLLVQIDQQRLTRRMLEGERSVAELSCDRVVVRPGNDAPPPTGDPGLDREISAEQPPCVSPAPGGELAPDGFLELEVELLADGSDPDLARIAGELRSDWRLSPVSESKLHRALAMVRQELDPEKLEEGYAPNLTAEERACLERLAQERAVLARRARMLLAWDEGASLADMLARSGLSPRRARYWRWAFRQSRMAIFPEAAVQPAPVPEPEPLSMPPDVPAHPAPVSAPEPVQPAPASAATSAPSQKIGVRRDALMCDAGRLVLAFHFRRMLANEPGTREGSDVEALHDMRVATRRLRAAFRVFGAFYDRRATQPFLKALRRTGEALGQVRDLDVFEIKTRAYADALPEARRGGLDAFLAELDAQRDAARRQLLGHLDGGGYARFVARFGAWLESRTEPEATLDLGGGSPRPLVVRHVAPVAVMERLAAVRAFEGWVEGPDVPLERYHALRIAAKRLRYSLEFFSDVLGPEGKALVGKTVALQDHLGLLQDGVVASGILRDFLMWGTWGAGLRGKKPHARTDSLVAPGVALYLAARQTEIQDLLSGFPGVWAVVAGPEFARRVAAVVGTL